MQCGMHCYLLFDLLLLKLGLPIRLFELRACFGQLLLQIVELCAFVAEALSRAPELRGCVVELCRCRVELLLYLVELLLVRFGVQAELSAQRGEPLLPFVCDCAQVVDEPPLLQERLSRQQQLGFLHKSLQSAQTAHTQQAQCRLPVPPPSSGTKCISSLLRSPQCAARPPWSPLSAPAAAGLRSAAALRHLLLATMSAYLS